MTVSQLAKHITRSRGCRISWITPLGLPVVQPYVKQSDFDVDLWTGGSSTQANAEMWAAALTKAARRTEQQLRSGGSGGARDSLVGLPSPNPVKQRNAFPPNFIHSLDSCHMMLTALHCLRAGVMFASVHDCFWTHAASVDLLNRVSWNFLDSWIVLIIIIMCRSPFFQFTFLKIIKPDLHSSFPQSLARSFWLHFNKFSRIYLYILRDIHESHLIVCECACVIFSLILTFSGGLHCLFSPLIN